MGRGTPVGGSSFFVGKALVDGEGWVVLVQGRKGVILWLTVF